MRDITPLVAPESITVIGASTNPEKSGGILFNNLLHGGFSGSLYPINPRAAEVMGCKAYPTVGEVGEPIDLAYVVLPRQFVKEVGIAGRLTTPPIMLGSSLLVEQENHVDVTVVVRLTGPKFSQ